MSYLLDGQDFQGISNTMSSLLKNYHYRLIIETYCQRFQLDSQNGNIKSTVQKLKKLNNMALNLKYGERSCLIFENDFNPNRFKGNGIIWLIHKLRELKNQCSVGSMSSDADFKKLGLLIKNLCVEYFIQTTKGNN